MSPAFISMIFAFYEVYNAAKVPPRQQNYFNMQYGYIFLQYVTMKQISIMEEKLFTSRHCHENVRKGWRRAEYPTSPNIPEPVFLNVYGVQESIPRNEFRQPM